MYILPAQAQLSLPATFSIPNSGSGATVGSATYTPKTYLRIPRSPTRGPVHLICLATPKHGAITAPRLAGVCLP
jgi:hypothetical protein